MGVHHFKQGLAGVDFANMSYEEHLEYLWDLLNDGIHGFCFSPYLDGQGPGTEVPAEQIRQRLEIIRPHARWIRTFSSTEGHQHSATIAKEMGLKTMVGVSIGHDHEKNLVELYAGIELANSGNADILAVGNEVLLRGDVSLSQLIDYIEIARNACPGITIGYVDAYFQFEVHPALISACDVMLINCYPYWEDTPVEHSLLYVKEMYRRVQACSQGKPVIISETGWPSQGEAKGATVPSLINMLRYFINVATWCEKDGIELFYFTSFDEMWKVGDEGDVGAYWGLWDKDGNFKYESLNK